MNLELASGFRGKNLVGKRFTRLLVLSYAGKNPRREAHWKCLCDCGSQLIVYGNSLKRQVTKSCGCLSRERAYTLSQKFLLRHGYTVGGQKLGTYAVWATMVQRCSNPNHHKYPSYGGRGISVCDRWRSFENFIADVGDRPTDLHQIERKDNNGNYEPGNCRWATRKEQARNRRDNHFLEFEGRKATIAEWSEITKIAYGNIKNRINNLGWSVKDALTKPVKSLC